MGQVERSGEAGEGAGRGKRKSPILFSFGDFLKLKT